MKTVRQIIASNGVTYLYMRSVDRTARQEGRRKKRRVGEGLSVSVQTTASEYPVGEYL